MARITRSQARASQAAHDEIEANQNKSKEMYEIRRSNHSPSAAPQQSQNEDPDTRNGAAGPTNDHAVRKRLSETTIDPSNKATAGPAAPVEDVQAALTAPNDSEMHEDIQEASAATSAPKDRSQNERNADVTVANDPTGRVGRKRSLEDLGDAENGGTSNAPKHIRKRSRELEEDGGRHSPKDDTHQGESRPAQKPTYTEAASEFTDGSRQTEAGASSGQDATGTTGQKSPTKIPASSGFANASMNSPFASLTSKSADPKASGGFAASGFASFASSTQSPFGGFGASSQNTKISTNTSNEKSSPGVDNQPAKLSFTSSGTSAFNSPSTGFGGLGGNASPFASGFGSGSKLTSFAGSSGKKLVSPSNKGLPAFGVRADGDDDKNAAEADSIDENGTSDAPIAIADGNDVQDERFYKRKVGTGEEGERTVFSQRAKLYVNVDKVWKERGVGLFKMNVGSRPNEGTNNVEGTAGDRQDSKRLARFIMRADGSHRTVLNSPVTDEVTVKDRHGGPPRSQLASFLGFIDGKPALCMLKMKSKERCEDLDTAVKRFKAEDSFAEIDFEDEEEGIEEQVDEQQTTDDQNTTATTEDDREDTNDENDDDDDGDNENDSRQYGSNDAEVDVEVKEDDIDRKGVGHLDRDEDLSTVTPRATKPAEPDSHSEA